MEAERLFSNAWATAFIPSQWGIFVYNEATSMVTRMDPFGGGGWIALTFLRKAPVSFT